VNSAMVSVPALWGLVVVGYLLGSIPFGFLLVRGATGRDIRDMGSGNIGATNVARSAGPGIGFVTLLLDAAKGYLAVWLIAHFSSGNIRFMMYAGLAAILGHMFPVWLGFSGGKGVATTLGVFVGICWQALLLAVAVFVIVFLFWRYVSLASVSAAATLPLFLYLLYAPGHAPPTAISAGTLLAAILIIIKHRDNIERLINGTEPRFEKDREDS
jgi:acyl phosphate:glycerol-3-phosphate acyltransferase